MKRVLLTFILAVAAQAFAIPLQVNYQGQLTRSDGTPLDTTVAMTFRFWDNAVGEGVAYWVELWPSVTVTNGLFNVTLGANTPLTDSVFDHPQLWMGIRMGTDSEMTPRVRLVSVGYSYRVGTVDDAAGGTIAGDVNISGKANIGSGNANTGTAAFVAGQNNAASGAYSTVGGGVNNFARGQLAVVAGGGSTIVADSNSALGVTSVVSGGAANVASGTAATVSGGGRNTASGSRATVGGGRLNRAAGDYSVVAGGGGGTSADSNLALGLASVVSGGESNRATGNWAVIAGGQQNSAAAFAAVGGGYNNTAADYTSIAGGSSNAASAPSSTIGGGGGNSTSGVGATVGGGYFNHARGDYSVISGGGGLLFSDSNSVLGSNSVIGGGSSNVIYGTHSVISGGASNCDSGSYAAVVGGFACEANGDYSIAGGRGSRASGDYSIALGRRAAAPGNGCIVIADGVNANFSHPDTLDNTFSVRATGGVWIKTNSALTSGVVLYGGSSTWQSNSDSTLKRNIRPVSTREILNKVVAMPMNRWSYKSQDESIEHIGPMAQDFWNAFRVGGDSLRISTIDPSGVALAAIQELAKQLEEERTAVRHYETRNLKLEEVVAQQAVRHDAELAELRAMVQSLISQNQQTALQR